MTDQRLIGLPRRAVLWAAAAGGVALATLLSLALHLELAGAAFMLLVVVALLALFGSLATALAAAGISLAVLLFVFVEPRFTLMTASDEDVRSLIVFAITSAAVVLLIRYVRNLSDRQRRAEDRLRQSEQAFLDEAQRLTQTGSLAWNVTTGEVVWSDETYRICGVDRSTALTLDFLVERLHADDRKGFQKAVATAVKERGRFDREIRFTRDDGEQRILHMLGHFLPQQPSQFVGALNDITERRRDELALRNSEFRYRNMFSAMAASFWELDFTGILPLIRNLKKAGITDHAAHFATHPEFVRDLMRATRIIDVNEQTVALFGRGDKAEIIASTLDVFWPESATQVYADSVIASLSRAPGFSAETRLRRIDGVEFEALFTVSFPAEGVVSSHFLVGIIDISERVDAQQELRRVQAEFAHAARLSTLGELAASIAHEVNQPLAAIATNASAGLRWLDRPQPNLEEVRTLATRISADARRAADIIARIRAMATRGSTEKAPLSITAIIDETAAFLRHDMHVQRVSLQLAISPHLPSVLGDRTQIQQVIVNLAMNAAQAMGPPTSASRRITLAAAQVGDDVVVTVEDTGPGIPPEHADRLFESFFTTKDGGMGIGLPICRSIVEAHGGRISAHNRDGGGACFRFTLPVHSAV